MLKYGEYFFGSPKLLNVSPLYLFSSQKLLLHRFCSPPHSFSPYITDPHLVVLPDLDAHSVTVFITHSDLCELSMYFGARIPDNFREFWVVGSGSWVLGREFWPYHCQNSKVRLSFNISCSDIGSDDYYRFRFAVQLITSRGFKTVCLVREM